MNSLARLEYIGGQLFASVLRFSNIQLVPYMLIRTVMFVLCRSEIQVSVRECLLLLGAEPFVFQVAIQKFKD